MASVFSLAQLSELVIEGALFYNCSADRGFILNNTNFADVNLFWFFLLGFIHNFQKSIIIFYYYIKNLQYRKFSKFFVLTIKFILYSILV